MNEEINKMIEVQMKKEIVKIFERNYCNTKEYILEYYDNCTFFARDMEQSIYKNLTSYLNRMVKKGHILKTSSGAGSHAKYTFPKEKMKELIRQVEKE